MTKAAAVHYSCAECGYSTGRWLGRCPGCGSFGTLAEEAAPAANGHAEAKPLLRLADVEVEDRLVGRLRARGRREDDRGFGDAPLLEAFHVLLLELHLVLVAEGAEFAFRDHALELLFAELELRHHVFEAEIVDHERLRCR